MTERTRNLIVGVFVIVGCVIMVGMAMAFKGGPSLAVGRNGYRVAVELDSLDGITEGSSVRLAGKRVGMVLATEVDPAREPPARVVLEIRRPHRLPVTTTAELVADTLGRRHVELTYLRPPRSEADWLPDDGPDIPVIKGSRSGSGLEQLAKQFSGTLARLELDVARMLRESTAVLANMNRVIEQNSAAVEKSITGISLMLGSKENQENLARLLAFLGDKKLHSDIAETTEGIRSVAADPRVQADLKAAAADARVLAANLRELSAQIRETTVQVDKLLAETGGNLREVTGSAKSAAANLEQLARELPGQVKGLNEKLLTDLDKLAAVLTSLQSVSRKVEQGEGSVGKLLTDPRLHEAMVDLVRSLQLIAGDLRELAKKWNDGGIKLRL